MKIIVLRTLLGILSLLYIAPFAYAEQTTACPAGKIDTLDWLTLDADLRNTKHMTGSHPLYTVMLSDKYYWLKTDSGKTWDIVLFDETAVYDWITENNNWETPYNYKKFTNNKNMPHAYRCATPGYPGDQILVSNSSYTPAVNCKEQAPSNLGRVVKALWGPYTAGQPGGESSRPSIGGIISDSTPTNTISYTYECNNNYENCQKKEEFILTQRYGLVRWNLWEKSGTQWTLSSRSTFNQLENGTISPFFPCF